MCLCWVCMAVVWLFASNAAHMLKVQSISLLLSSLILQQPPTLSLQSHHVTQTDSVNRQIPIFYHHTRNKSWMYSLCFTHELISMLSLIFRSPVTKISTKESQLAKQRSLLSSSSLVSPFFVFVNLFFSCHLASADTVWTVFVVCFWMWKDIHNHKA